MFNENCNYYKKLYSKELNEVNRSLIKKIESELDIDEDSLISESIKRSIVLISLYCELKKQSKYSDIDCDIQIYRLSVSLIAQYNNIREKDVRECLYIFTNKRIKTKDIVELINNVYYREDKRLFEKIFTLVSSREDYQDYYYLKVFESLISSGGSFHSYNDDVMYRGHIKNNILKKIESSVINKRYNLSKTSIQRYMVLSVVFHYLDYNWRTGVYKDDLNFIYNSAVVIVAEYYGLTKNTIRNKVERSLNITTDKLLLYINEFYHNKSDYLAKLIKDKIVVRRSDSDDEYCTNLFLNYINEIRFLKEIA